MKPVMVEPEAEGSRPFYSVVIPTYRSTQYICEALDSVFAQTYKNYEVIVVNDGTPDAAELELALKPHLHRIIYIKQDNKGPGGARNTGIMRARGEFVALLDSDDRWLPDHLADMASIVRKDPAVDLIYADALNFGDPKLAGHTSMETNPSNGVADFEGLIEGRCSVIASCVVARKQALIDAGLFDEKFVHAEDYDLWLRAAYQGKRIDYLRKVHSLRRIHDASLTSDTIKTYQGQAKVLRKLMKELPVSKDLKQKMKHEIERCNAHIALEKGKEKIVARQYKRAREELKQANEFFRRRKLTVVLMLLRAAPLVVRYFYVKR